MERAGRNGQIKGAKVKEPMLKKIVGQVGDRTIVLMDSITMTTIKDAGKIVIAASHGGVSSAKFALEFPLACVFFNDAGVGKDAAGTAALPILDAKGIPAATVSHTSARIGDAADMWENGVISHVNAAARAGGLRPGGKLDDAVFRFGLT